jgi:hypothetical protein
MLKDRSRRTPYTSAGDYVASLNVSDGNLGATATATVAIVETVAARAFTTGATT